MKQFRSFPQFGKTVSNKMIMRLEKNEPLHNFFFSLLLHLSSSSSHLIKHVGKMYKPFVGFHDYFGAIIKAKWLEMMLLGVYWPCGTNGVHGHPTFCSHCLIRVLCQYSLANNG